MIELVDTMVGIVRTNSLGFGKILGLCTGHSLCPSFSLLSHDCMSNCRYAGKELDEQDEAEKKGPRNTILVQVRAMKRIKKGEELSVQYKGALLGKRIKTYYRPLYMKRDAYYSIQRVVDTLFFFWHIFIFDLNNLLKDLQCRSKELFYT